MSVSYPSNIRLIAGEQEPRPVSNGVLGMLLFVITDGWYLIVESVVRGYLGS